GRHPRQSRHHFGRRDRALGLGAGAHQPVGLSFTISSSGRVVRTLYAESASGTRGRRAPTEVTLSAAPGSTEDACALTSLRRYRHSSELHRIRLREKYKPETN